ncbi:MAG TPA: Uma2 family endonuclease [Vicinamibacteria bacterium]
MATQTTTAELVAQLYRTEGKAEIVGGEVVLMSPAGGVHSNAAGNLYVSLRDYGRRTKRGRAYPDNAGFLVDLPHRKSFCPDASFYAGPPPGPRFLAGAPLLAVEVRSPDDYGPAAEKALAAKRTDYFAAGTKVVLDVEALREVWIHVYHANAPETPATFRRGEVAQAEPELPGWTFPVDDLLE